MSEIKPGEALGKIARYIVDLEADRDRASDACASVQRERDELREMLANLINIIDGTDHDENGCAVLRLDWWEVVNARAFLARYEGEVK